MIHGIHHVALTVAKAVAAEGFYARAAGMASAPDVAAALQLEQPPGVAASRFLRGSNMHLRLLEAKDPIFPAQGTPRRPVSQAGIVHLCMQSPKVDTVFEAFSSQGADFHGTPVDLGTGFLYCYARDLEQNVVEIEGVPPVWEDPTPWVAHVSFSSHDRDRLADFYAAVLGTTAHKSPDIGPRKAIDAVSGLELTRFKAAWIAGPNIQVEVIQYLQPATTEHVGTRRFSDLGYAYVAFEVGDVSHESRRFIAAGASQSTELAALSTPSQCYLADPDGNLLLLLALPEASPVGLAALPDVDVVARMAATRATLLKRKTTP